MSLAVVMSRAQIGVDAPRVDVEVHLSGGLPGTSIVGLPEAAVRESRDRVRAAIINAHLDFPQRRVTVNLAPADLPKDGCRFDLAIALGILAASSQIPCSALAEHEFLGELALSGELRPVVGVLPAVLKARRLNRTLIVPAENAAEASLVSDAKVLIARSLLEVCAHLRGECLLLPPRMLIRESSHSSLDLADVRGQPHARRALEIAAAGAHNLLMVGPPGTGKTMLALRLSSILPPLSDDEALESAAVRSVAGISVDPQTFRMRPTRSPHHSASAVALVGGGSIPKPGEISLAHHGILFLDELPEFDRRVLENLREPLESGRVLISRAARQAEFPARVQLIAAMNPCPCGYAGDPSGRCHCSVNTIAHYRARLSGPLLDRIDMHIEVPRINQSAWRNDLSTGEDSATVLNRVIAARNQQIMRAQKPNAHLSTREIERDCVIEESNHQLLDRAIENLGLSTRAYHRILRLARTIADLENQPLIEKKHLTEALSYRKLDRQNHR
jgi:magnesium chelatase family protein